MNDEPELFDLYDEGGQPLGRSKARELVHRDGDWHRSAHIWIYTGDGRLLFQRRAADKDTWPGRLDASIGGHYRAGEGPTGVGREAHEELGITVTPEELVPIGLRSVVSLEPGIVDRELQDIFLLRRDLSLAAYIPDPVELDGLTLLDAAAAAALHAGTLAELDAEFLPRGSVTTTMRRFSADDLIPERGPYIGAVADAVADLLAGRPPRPLDRSGEHV
jgi:isopentenyldiphosphate isomerase